MNSLTLLQAQLAELAVKVHVGPLPRQRNDEPAKLARLAADYRETQRLAGVFVTSAQAVRAVCGHIDAT